MSTDIRPHIVIAEDDGEIRRIFTRMVSLAQPNARVSAVSDGPSALALVAKDGADLVLTDYSMRPMDGVTLAEQLRERGFEAPILMTSGLIAIQASALAAGVTAFLPKPFDMEQLLSIVRSLLVAV